ncbi:hypothetical protein G6F46_009970 [Rhizopus delemar]|uniref:Uncharacterized protein n=3 Tax=Rhizopus TaxID=4842 RepID=I1CSC3_RHIO9|nr:hypothetical protein RO3G_16064 [Rhizopus delemar RA 99-880]KAG1048704.1 hypothetical protein G6F43_008929 [Rhizopus delemar]KAG1540276.1 hypothetical protein G6F51_008625 [Rhizopus arrhizus]KAG1461918.1 hypothetical protein G6F55_003286 [Rhizopus delemar]KAG1494474.1 hypothetical protein G6F54_007851 [Rhizopus delemar]|eukprot:EIE91353.1 hypothetical protein RO3G_16064 [Rhizopus delemar RA 99-880]
MADLNWCTFCDKAVSPFSESLYCSEQCLRADALRNHPLLGYTYPEFTDFPRPKSTKHSSSSSIYSSPSSSPSLSASSSQPDSIHFSPPKLHLPSTHSFTTKKNHKHIHSLSLFH